VGVGSGSSRRAYHVAIRVLGEIIPRRCRPLPHDHLRRRQQRLDGELDRLAGARPRCSRVSRPVRESA